jgi:hypothetical protein
MKSTYQTLVVALACATLIKLYLALATHGSIDIGGFLDHLQKVRELGVGAYRILEHSAIHLATRHVRQD